MFFSSKPAGLVDYDDDEDDEDYKPPPRRQPDASDGDASTLELSRVKRRVAAEEEPELIKKQRLDKNSKLKENIFAAQCSTISQAVLPNKDAASIVHNSSHGASTKTTNNCNHQQHNEADLVRDHIVENSSGDDNRSEQNIIPQNNSNTSPKSHENGQLKGEEHPHVPANTSSEMAVNGS